MDQLGPFRLRKRLAVGGMGEVYLGEKIGPEGFVKPVVLKCVLPQLAKDRAFVQLFLDEARLAALLNHPNIAQVYDFGLIDDIYFIAMEYVPGYTVDDIRRKLKSIGQFMPIEHVTQIASQVCQGLHHAHSMTDANGVSLGLVHRDVSPHNLIVSIDGSVKIVDFGIAKARAGLTRVQAKGAVGKFGYMSPEQSRGETVDGRSDVFSLGICLWELATNERLHDPNLERPPEYSPARPVKSVELIRSDIPRQFVQIIEKALAIVPDDRFPDCKEMHLQLERFMAAMTHYAGQATLAEYIKDLVEGRVEHPEERATGTLVEPASRAGSVRARPGKRIPNAGDSLEAAQKYEEVFGIAVEGQRTRGKLKAVPASWETRAPESGSETVVETLLPKLEIEQRPVVKRARIPPGSGHSQSGLEFSTSKRSSTARSVLFALLMLGILAGAGYTAFEQRDWLRRHFVKTESPQSTLTSVYRIESQPAGAAVLLDGRKEKQGTPLEVELIPQVEYLLTLKKAGYGTIDARVKAEVAPSIQSLKFVLSPAATLQVVTQPPGASISVNGRVISDQVTPMTLNDVPGGRTLRVVASIKGMPDLAETVEVAVGTKKTLRLSWDRP